MYENNAYTITVIYRDGSLELFAQRPIQPTAPCVSTKYRMTLIRSLTIGDNPDSFRQRDTPFRNVQALAIKKRDEFKPIANVRMPNTAS